ncbi:hypothetical protein LINPERPRIM_LOCUS29545 [Linum perenne]
MTVWHLCLGRGVRRADMPPGWKN